MSFFFFFNNVSLIEHLELLPRLGILPKEGMYSTHPPLSTQTFRFFSIESYSQLSFSLVFEGTSLGKGVQQLSLGQHLELRYLRLSSLSCEARGWSVKDSYTEELLQTLQKPTGEEKQVKISICVKYKASQAQFSDFIGKKLPICMKVALRHQGCNILQGKAL